MAVKCASWTTRLTYYCTTYGDLTQPRLGAASRSEAMSVKAKDLRRLDELLGAEDGGNIVPTSHGFTTDRCVQRLLSLAYE